MVLNFSIRNGKRWFHHCMNVDIYHVFSDAQFLAFYEAKENCSRTKLQIQKFKERLHQKQQGLPNNASQTECCRSWLTRKKTKKSQNIYRSTYDTINQFSISNEKATTAEKVEKIMSLILQLKTENEILKRKIDDFHWKNKSSNWTFSVWPMEVNHLHKHQHMHEVWMASSTKRTILCTFRWESRWTVALQSNRHVRMSIDEWWHCWWRMETIYHVCNIPRWRMLILSPREKYRFVPILDIMASVVNFCMIASSCLLHVSPFIAYQLALFVAPITTRGDDCWTDGVLLTVGSLHTRFIALITFHCINKVHTQLEHHLFGESWSCLFVVKIFEVYQWRVLWHG